MQPVAETRAASPSCDRLRGKTVFRTAEMRVVGRRVPGVRERTPRRRGAVARYSACHRPTGRTHALGVMDLLDPDPAKVGVSGPTERPRRVVGFTTAKGRFLVYSRATGDGRHADRSVHTRILDVGSGERRTIHRASQARCRRGINALPAIRTLDLSEDGVYAGIYAESATL